MKIVWRIVWIAVACMAAFSLGRDCARTRRAREQHLAGPGRGRMHTLIGYRFYAQFIAAKVMALDDQRATPAERLRNGHDFEPTNKWIVFGHHFAAIAGPGPLVGPDARGAVRLSAGNAVDHHRRGARRRRAGLRDPVLLDAARRQVARADGARGDRQGRRLHGAVTVLLIMIILLAVVALVVVNALKDSPWGTFTIAATMPIAVFMGLYLRYWRPGKVLECSVIGFVPGDAEHLRRTVGVALAIARAGVHAVRVSRWRSRSSSTASSRARCRCGCCLRRAIT